MRKRAVIYARLSPTPRGEEAKGGNIDQQVSICREVCDAQGWEVARIITEMDASATMSKPRQGWREVIDLVRAGSADIVIGRHYDRLYRRPIDLEELVQLTETTGVTLVAAEADATGLDLTTATGRAQARFMAAGAAMETDLKRERHKRGQERRVSAGKPWWVNRPYGYEKDGAIRESEASHIRAAYGEVLRGVTIGTIARRWNEQGLTTPKAGETKNGRVLSGAWTSSNVKRLLIHPRNAAIFAYKLEEMPEVEATWAALVDRETFYAVRRLLSDPTRATKNDGFKRQGLLSGIATCGKEVDGVVCGGHVLLTANRPRKDGSQLRRYECERCHGASHPMDALDDLVMLRLYERAAHGLAAAVRE